MIASNYRIKDEDGQWVEDPHWNEITVFNKARQAYIEEHVTKGDLVHVRGRIRQNSYKRPTAAWSHGGPDRHGVRPAGAGFGAGAPPRSGLNEEGGEGWLLALQTDLSRTGLVAWAQPSRPDRTRDSSALPSCSRERHALRRLTALRTELPCRPGRPYLHVAREHRVSGESAAARRSAVAHPKPRSR